MWGGRTDDRRRETVRQGQALGKRNLILHDTKHKRMPYTATTYRLAFASRKGESGGAKDGFRSIRAERDVSEVGPPDSLDVEAVPRVVLYAADGTPMVRLIGFTK
jgi:hypothetical protein